MSSPTMSRIIRAGRRVMNGLNTLEPDVLLVTIVGSSLVLFKLLAPFWSLPDSMLSWLSCSLLLLSICASWTVAGRFAEQHSHDAVKFVEAKHLWAVFAIYVLGIPVLCSFILPLVMPSYNSTWAVYHLIASTIPSLLIVTATRQDSTTSTLPIVSVSPSHTLFKLRTPVAFTPAVFLRRAACVAPNTYIPIRVALLKGVRFARPKQAVHPLWRMRQPRKLSALRFEVAVEEGRHEAAAY